MTTHPSVILGMIRAQAEDGLSTEPSDERVHRWIRLLELIDQWEAATLEQQLELSTQLKEIRKCLD